MAPEVQAARALFSPDNQRQIERLADDLELILGGEAPEPSSRRLSPDLAARRRSRRAFSLWIGVPVAVLFILVAAVFGGWASALQYHNVAENERTWAQEQEALRIELQAWKDRHRQIVGETAALAFDLGAEGKYAEAMLFFEVFNTTAEALRSESPELYAEFDKARRATLVRLIGHLYEQDVDLTSLDRVLLELTRPENPPSTEGR